MTIGNGDTVVLKGSVIKRSGHSESARNFIGVVKNVFGKVCEVETIDGVRGVPVANLAKKKSKGLIIDPN
jgi:hypothetical protein